MRLRTRQNRASERLKIRTTYLQEPALVFAGGREHVDQKTGLAVFGPASLGTKRHPGQIKLGFVGSGTSVGFAQQWFAAAAEGVQGDPTQGFRDFPGCAHDRGFYTDVVQDSALIETITQHDLAEIAAPKLLRDRFEVALKVVADRVRLLSQRDDPPDCVILALPDELLAHSQTVDYRDAQLGLIHRDFRRAVKAEVMRYKLPTQIVRQKTMEGDTGDHHSRVAWNLFTSLFYKGKGVPWRPSGLHPGTCYIGISFFRPLATESGTLHTSVAQAFDEHGTGLILRGPDFSWNVQEGGRSAHLSDEQAHELMQLVLGRYREETGQTPARVVVHKTSRFFPAEQDGFQQALKDIGRFDLVAINSTDEVRLVRAGKYPPLRGTLFEVGLTQYLYTTGFIPALNAYPHGHVPSPLQIADHHGDGYSRQLCEEILQLTKMNWNSAGFAGSFPITIRFSRLVGDIMREIPKDREPEPAFKFYS